ncbi:hypothetical protein MASR1M66_04300 [Aminivibrio sp.]
MASAMLAISEQSGSHPDPLNLLLLFIGTFMETVASIIILVRSLLPVVTQLGVDPSISASSLW